MKGCLKSLAAKLAIVLLLVLATYVGWRWGPQVFPRIQEWMGLGETGEAEVLASPELADSALARVQLFRRGEGPTQMALGGDELTSLLRYSETGVTPDGVASPRVTFSDGRVRLGVQVALSAFPDLPDLGPIIGILPDTLDVAVEASLLPFGTGSAAILVHGLEASRIPLPRRMIPEVLTAMGRKDQPGLPPEAYLVRLPSGLSSAYILTDSLILSKDP
jgi:hypothetical protein